MAVFCYFFHVYLKPPRREIGGLRKPSLLKLVATVQEAVEIITTPFHGGWDVRTYGRHIFTGIEIHGDHEPVIRFTIFSTQMCFKSRAVSW